MSSIANQTPTSTYGDLLQIANGGTGIQPAPGQIQDGLGNLTNMTISSAATNFDRTIGQFQLDGVALTASATTLNNLSSNLDSFYLLYSPDAGLPSSLVLDTTGGITNSIGGGIFTVSTTGNLAGLNSLGTTGIMIREGLGTYSTVHLDQNGTLTILNPDGTGGNPYISVTPDSVVEKVISQLSNIPQSTRSTLNFIPGANTGISVVDDVANNRTNISISSGVDIIIHFKTACYAATVANLNAVYANGAAGVGATLTNNGALAAFALDGTNPPLNSRILVKDQTLPQNNGIYTLTTVGDGATAWVLTRATDYNTPAQINPGDFIPVLNGTVNAHLAFIEIDTVTTIGTDPIVFQQFGITSTITVVNGTAGQIDVANPTTTPTISIDPAYVGQNSITTLGTVTTGAWHGTPVTVPYGGTGNTTFTAYSVICAGTTATGTFQNVTGTGNLDDVLTSNGAGALPSWAPSSISIFGELVIQGAHGFTVGQLIRVTGTDTYALAKADNAADAEVIGIVIQVLDVNTFVYQFGGIVRIFTGGGTQPNVTAGTGQYFLSPTTAGAYQPTAPSVAGQIIKPVFYPIDTTTAIWTNQLGLTV